MFLHNNIISNTKMNIKDKFINECVIFLKDKHIQDEMKIFFKPLINMLLIEIYPYIYISMIFVIISFLLILGIFVILIKNSIPLYIFKSKSV